MTTDEERSLMIKRIASILIAVGFAAAGVVAGRLFIDLRRQVEEGEELHVDADRIRMQPRELVPGLIAAMRVRDRPWSFLHVPGWLAAFAINFGFVAFASELAPVRAVLGFDLFEPDDDDGGRRDARPFASEPAANETVTVREVVTEERTAEASMPVWTAENAAAADPPGQSTPGFTPLPG